MGTYSGSNSGVNGGTVTNVAFASGDLTVNGVVIGASVSSADTASTANADASAIAKAAAINQVSAQTGVTAKAAATQITSAAVTATTTAAFTINGVSITAASGANIGEKMANLVSNINQKADQSGVRAEIVDGDQYQLIADDG